MVTETLEFPLVILDTVAMVTDIHRALQSSHTGERSSLVHTNSSRQAGRITRFFRDELERCLVASPVNHGVGPELQSNTLRSGFEHAGEPEEQEADAPEEEEEEDLVDPQGVLRDQCVEKNAKCQELKDILDKCNERVAVNPAIEEETCEEELIDFVHCVDHCVSKTLFSKLV